MIFASSPSNQSAAAPNTSRDTSPENLPESSPAPAAATDRKPAHRRGWWVFGAVLTCVVLVPLVWSLFAKFRFPSEKTPEGAYLRLVVAFGPGKVRDAFPYLEDEAQAALYTIHEYRKKSLEKVRAVFKEPERSRWEAEYRQQGDAPDPESLWVVMAAERGWDRRMRKDLSGIATIERKDRRVTVETARGTRYPFRLGDNGIWGLTLFTADLVDLKQRAARDYQLVEKASEDYERAPRN